MNTLPALLSSALLAVASTSCASHSTVTATSPAKAEPPPENTLQRWKRAVEKKNVELQANLDEMRSQEAQRAEFRGNPDLYELRQRPIVVTDTTQYISNQNGQLTAVPFTPVVGQKATQIVVVKSPGSLSNIKNYQRVKAAYAGFYPYTVVNAKEPFVIVNQANDPVVVGVPQPRRAVIQPTSSGFTLRREGDTIVAMPVQNQPVDVIYVENRLELSIKMPPGVPGRVIEKVGLYNHDGSTQEATYQPNQKYAWADLMADAKVNVQKARVYRVHLP